MAQHILHINPYYLPDVAFGGPVFSVSALCEALVKTGHRVTVYTVGYENDTTYPLHTTLNGVEVVYFKGNAGSPCQVSWQLWAALEENCRRFDAVHLHTWWNVLVFRAIKILQRHKVPYVVSPRGMLSDYSFTHRKTWLKKRFQEYLGVGLLEKATLHATSLSEAEDMARRCQRPLSDIFLMPNLLNLQPAAAYQPVAGSYSIGFLSRLHHKKGIEELLKALPLCPQVSQLVIGGSGDAEYTLQLQRLAESLGVADRIEFAGWISDEDKPAFFRRFQVFVLPSFSENFANVVAEAWAAGKPVIVARGVGLSNYVEAHQLGWVCEANPDSIGSALATAWQQQDSWPAMGERALQLVASQFTDDRIISDYAGMYRQMAQTKPLPAGNPAGQDVYVLGINAHHADASAAILKNGELLAALEEERITRVKHWAGFPEKAIAFCLAEAGIGLGQLHRIAISRDPRAKWWKKARFALSNPEAVGFAVRGRLNNAEALGTVEQRFQEMAAAEGAGDIAGKLVHVEHHRSHLASAFFASGFEEAALLSIDGSGDFSTTMLGVGRGLDIEVLGSIDFPHSMGIFYTAFTQLLGFPYYGDEYKVMGLAPYGQPLYYDKLQQVVRWLPNGSFRLEEQWFRRPEKGYVRYNEQHQPIVPTLYSPALEGLVGKARQPHEPLTQQHKDLAASVQKMLEETLFHLLRHLHRQTGLTRLCVAGGVAQNSVANGKISRNTPFTEIYVPSAGHDAGLSMGAAMLVAHQQLRLPRTPALRHAYTGPRYSHEEIKKVLAERVVKHTFVQEDQQLCDQVAQCIAAGGVVGWFRGRSEFGPRALGNRSILADPRRADAKDLLNQKIKRRESFRPFAPSILAEFASEYFGYCEDAPFMEKVFPIKPEKQQIVPAVTHVDGTGRLQTVTRDQNPVYYQLIHTFYTLTGVPVLLNTSFNENEPIVNSPAEALDCFERTHMDMLVLENFLIIR